MDNITVIVPSLDPDYRLNDVVNGLIDVGFTDIVLVDDGSKAENKKYFPSGECITLLKHEVNKGKGAAIKTALKYVKENRPDSIGVVTCDGDGQHLSKDIKNVAERLVETGRFILGVRDFSLPDVPFKSRFGNKISSGAMAIFGGIKIEDTQTGLRGIPAFTYERMIDIKGDRFEYETNVLLELSSMKCDYTQVKIETVYHDDNKGTHFRPIRDSIRIMSLMLKYAFSSFSSFLVDNGLFLLLHSVFSMGAFFAVICARIVSSVFNYILNKKLVFRSNASVIKSLLKYYLVAVPVMLISAFGLSAVTKVLQIKDGSFVTTLIKIFIDTILFVLNYLIQKKWIFKKK